MTDPGDAEAAGVGDHAPSLGQLQSTHLRRLRATNGADEMVLPGAPWNRSSVHAGGSEMFSTLPCTHREEG